jgi:hypothetical protein
MKFYEFHNFQIMDKYLNDLSSDKLAQLCCKLYQYVLIEIEDGTQLAICKETGITAPTISRILAQKEIKSKIKLKAHFWRLMNAYKISYDISTETFSDGVKPSIQKGNLSTPAFIGGIKGNYWMIMVHLQERGKKSSMVGLRYLRIGENGKAEFFVGSEEHDDYIGHWNYSSSGRQIDFELKINNDGNEIKDVNLRFIIGNRTARPKFMTGFMMHSYLNDSGVSVFTIFAENISGSGLLPEPKRYPLNNSRKHILKLQGFSFKGIRLYIALPEF